MSSFNFKKSFTMQIGVNIYIQSSTELLQQKQESEVTHN